MTDIAIRLDRVSKRFKLYSNPITGPVQEMIFFWKRQQYYKEFMAVKDASLEIKRGEVVGIVGANGAGKTTLLKMIAGLLKIDAGRLEINGKVTALMALGVGVHPEFTGRENILYSGMLLGMSKKEVQQKMEGIIAFSELGDYVERPFRTYSSGMKARLLFSTFVSIEPDILIIDEALSTGDTYFVQKSSERIRELCHSGATVLFVSHNLSQIERLCDRAYFMAHGSIEAEGNPTEIIKAYQQWVMETRQQKLIAQKVSTLTLFAGTGEVQLTAVNLFNAEGNHTSGFRTGDSMIVELDYVRQNPQIQSVNFLLGFYIATSRQWVAEFTNFQEIEFVGHPREQAAVSISDKGTIRVTFPELPLLTHEYTLRVMIASASRENHVLYSDYHHVCAFSVSKPSDPISIGPMFLLKGTVE